MSRRGLLKSGLGAGAAGAAAMLASRPAGAAEASRRISAQPYDTRLVLLGTGGGPVWWPSGDREGASSAVVVGDAVYLVDCGDGVGRQYKRAELGQNNRVSGMSGMENLRGIFFTHLHSDHTIDYAKLFLFGWYNGLAAVKQPVQVYGPGRRGELEPVFTAPGQPPRPEPKLVNPSNPTPGIVDMTKLLFDAYALDINDRLRDAGRLDLNEIIQPHDIVLPKVPGFRSPNETPEPDMAPFVIHEDDRVRVSATLVNHAPIFPAFAYRFDSDDGSVAFSGDTAPSNNLIRLARNCDVLVHEVIDVSWVDALFPPPMSAKDDAFRNHLLSSHTSIEQVGKVAEAAGARTLVLSHIVPGHAPRKNLMQAQRNFSGQLIIGEDLMQVGVGRRRQASS